MEYIHWEGGDGLRAANRWRMFNTGLLYKKYYKNTTYNASTPVHGTATLTSVCVCVCVSPLPRRPLFFLLRYIMRLQAVTAAGEKSGYSSELTVKTLDQGNCGNAHDLPLQREFMANKTFTTDLETCLFGCFTNPNKEVCSEKCMHNSIGLSDACAGCWVEESLCLLEHCAPCISTPKSAACTNCSQVVCWPPLEVCTGLPPFTFP